MDLGSVAAKGCWWCCPFRKQLTRFFFSFWMFQTCWTNPFRIPMSGNEHFGIFKHTHRSFIYLSSYINYWSVSKLDSYPLYNNISNSCLNMFELILQMFPENIQDMFGLDDKNPMRVPSNFNEMYLGFVWPWCRRPGLPASIQSKIYGP